MSPDQNASKIDSKICGVAIQRIGLAVIYSSHLTPSFRGAPADRAKREPGIQSCQPVLDLKHAEARVSASRRRIISGFRGSSPASAVRSLAMPRNDGAYYRTRFTIAGVMSR